MADYRSILDRAISGLPENTEEGRRTIYDKARNALMRQLSSLEPALSPAEISKQRLQLEEAVRDTENQYNDTGALEDAVSEAVSEPDAPMVEHQPPVSPDETVSDAAPQSEPEIKQEVESAPEPTFQPSASPEAPQPAATQDAEPDAPAHPTPEEAETATPAPQVDSPEPQPEMAQDDAEKATEEIASETKSDEVVETPSKSFEGAPPSVSEAEDVIEAVSSTVPPTAHEKPEATTNIPDISSTNLKSQKLIEEADATHARVDAIRSEKSSALDELKEAMAADGVPVAAPEVVIKPEKDEPALSEETVSFSADTPENKDSALTRENAALIAASSKKSGGKGLLWILLLLIVFGIGAFGWAQRDELNDKFGSFITPAYEKFEQSISGLFSTTPSDEDQQAPSSTPDDSLIEAEIPEKSEDRILDTPLETAPQESEAPTIKPGERITLPTEVPSTVPLATPSPVTTPQTTPSEPTSPPAPDTPPSQVPVPAPSDSTSDDQAAAPATEEQPSQATTTPVTNIFTSSAILYEERKDSGRPDVSTGNVIWELQETGSEAIGSEGLPSVRGNSRIQNRDLNVRFEIMRNLDESLPASHLIEMEFETGTLFAEDGINNVAGVLMKEREQDNGQPLAGAVVKVSDTVFWIAMSARAADLASNIDALKGKKWFDIPIIFKSGKRAILTLEKGAAGAKAIEEAFAAWEKSSQ